MVLNRVLVSDPIMVCKPNSDRDVSHGGLLPWFRG